jgi:hypothetical protein
LLVCGALLGGEVVLAAGGALAGGVRLQAGFAERLLVGAAGGAAGAAHDGAAGGAVDAEGSGAANGVDGGLLVRAGHGAAHLVAAGLQLPGERRMRAALQCEPPGGWGDAAGRNGFELAAVAGQELARVSSRAGGSYRKPSARSLRIVLRRLRTLCGWIHRRVDGSLGGVP